jgi:hypothetical protein
MGANKSKPQINSECPICYIDSTKTNGLVLQCGHYYSYSCIQKHCLKTILHMKVSKCPLCNNPISKKDIRLIYKKPSILSSDPKDWYRRDIYHLGSMSNMNGIKFVSKYFKKNELLIIAPLFKTSGIFLPAYINSTSVTDIKITDHELFKTELTKEILNNYERFPELLMSVEATSTRIQSVDWIALINQIIIYLGKNDLARDLIDIRKDKRLASFRKQIKKQKYRFFLPADTSNINYVDMVEEMVKKGFDYDGSTLKGIYHIQFQPVIYVFKQKAYLVNRITGIYRNG